ncbi:DUF759 family protein, partial [Borreliella burgdorferi]
NNAESIQSNLASAEQTLQNLTTTVLNPLLNIINWITEKIKNFNFTKDILNPIINGIKQVLDIGRFIRQLVQAIKNWWNGVEEKEDKSNQNQDNANSTP